MPDPERWATAQEQYQALLSRYLELVSKYQGAIEHPPSRARLGDVLLQHTPDGIAIIRSGKVISCNRPFHALCALRPYWKRVSSSDEEDRASLQAVLTRGVQELLEGGKVRASFRVRPVNAPAPVVEATAVRLDESGQVPQVGLILRDQTETERYAEELRGAERRDEFLATLAHELRNPLTPISGAAEYLLHASDDPAVRRFAEIILRQARHQSRMIEDLLDVARVREGKLRLELSPVNLCEVVREAVEATEACRIGGPRFGLKIPEGDVWVEGDSTRLVQVVTNLLNNAAKFTPAEGSNWLELSVGEGIARLRVGDSGMGITPEMISQVWQTFVQEDRPFAQAKGGLGIGLSLVKSVIELHGGGVRAVSDGVGRGSEFTVWLPLRTAPAPAPPSQQLAENRPLRILLVEDNADARETIQELLSAYGHQVSAAASFSEAMRSALDGCPEAMVIDLLLPDRDGATLAQALRPLLPNTLFIAMSGHLSPEIEARIQRAGFDACLQKPLELESLLQALSAAMH